MSITLRLAHIWIGMSLAFSLFLMTDHSGANLNSGVILKAVAWFFFIALAFLFLDNSRPLRTYYRLYEWMDEKNRKYRDDRWGWLDCLDEGGKPPFVRTTLEEVESAIRQRGGNDHLIVEVTERPLRWVWMRRRIG